MLDQFTQLYPHGLIRYTQTSFLELITDTEVHRIDFQGKISYHLQRGTYGPISFHHAHPLLTGVNGTLTTLLARATRDYLPDAHALLAAIRQEVRNQAGEWYDFTPRSWYMWWHRLSAHNIVPSLTRTGGLILTGVPLSVVEAVTEICTHHGVETYFCLPQEPLPTQPVASPYQLLLIGRNYVIARDFFVSTLR